MGKSDIKQAYAFYVFEKGGHVQQLIHALKYYDNKELAYSLGSLAFRTLLYEKHPICDFDVLLPVPLHPSVCKSADIIKRNGLQKVYNRFYRPR